MKSVALFCVLAACFVVQDGAQTCDPPQIVANARSSNLFTPDQEMVLGRITEQKLAGEFKEVRDPALLSYVESIGDKVIKHLPQTGLKFKFHIIDYPQANAFNTPGGHVYITRKLIAFVTSEDELAGVIGHELGHATVHHGAIDFSAALKRVLNVTSLGDEKDIIDKYNLLIENARTKRSSSSESHEDDKQLEADKIGFYAMVAAGYDPNAMFGFFDRLSESKGKTGSWFGDIFGGGSTPDQKRLREIAKSTENLPKGCVEGRSARPTEEFLKWQSEVVMFRDNGRREELPGLIAKKQISPRLRSDIRRFQFSNDGKLLLAQDDESVTLIDRPSLKVLFQVPAPEADDAMITPDNSSIVFVTDNLRFERWGIAEQKNIAARELSIRRDCWEHTLSPDGNFLGCVDTAGTINVLDTRTGKKIWEKKKFYELDYFEYLIWTLSDSSQGLGFFRIKFSPDSRYVLFSRSNKYRYRISLNGLNVVGSEDSAVALDLTTLKQADIGGDIKKLTSRPYDFVDSEHVIGNTDARLESGGVFTFPEGKKLTKLSLGADEFKMSQNKDYLLVKPLKDAQLGVYSIKNNALAAGIDKRDITFWNDISAMENTSGSVQFLQVTTDDKGKITGSKVVGSVEIPASDIRGVQAADVSDNLRWLALSSKTRGGLWDLSSGERLLYTRGFRGAILDEAGAAVADFPIFRDSGHALVLLNPAEKQPRPLRPLQDYGAKQYGRFVLTRKSMLPDDDSKGGATEPSLQTDATKERAAESHLRRDVTFEIRDWIKDQVIWTRDFKGAVPRYSFDEYSGRLIIYWWLGGNEGKAFANSSPEIRQQADSLGDKSDDYIIEVVDAFQKKTIATFPLETGKGSFTVRQGHSEGDWLVVRDNEGRVLAYSTKTGALKYRYFGDDAALSPLATHLAVENFPGELTLYDLASGNPVARFVVNGEAVLLRFTLDGSKLFVFTASQTAYVFDLKKLPKPDDRLGIVVH